MDETCFIGLGGPSMFHSFSFHEVKREHIHLRSYNYMISNAMI